MENLKPNTKRARTAILLILIVLAVNIISFISNFQQYILLQSIAKGVEVSIETANANDSRASIIAIIDVIVNIISGVTFILWFRRAYFNLHQKTDNLLHTEGWAAGCWFVPVLNFYRPFQIMKELFQRTKELLQINGVIVKPKLSIWILRCWWTLWIIEIIFAKASLRLSTKAESIDQLISTTAGDMVVNIIGLPLALITIKIIHDYSKVEPMLYEIKELDTVE
jgi:hypothetical protein